MVSNTLTSPDTMDLWVKKRVNQGRYGDEGAYIRELIRRDQDEQSKLAELRAAIAGGCASGISDFTVSDIVADAEANLNAGT